MDKQKEKEIQTKPITNIKAKTKKKKKHTARNIILIILAVIIVIPIAFVFGGLITYKSQKDVSKIKEVPINTLINDSLFDALKNINVENGEMSITLGENELDSLLMTIPQKLPENVKPYFPNMYCYVKDDHYTFYLDAQYSVFRTNIVLDTKIQVSEIDDSVIFYLQYIKVGHIPIPDFAYNLVLDNLSDMINDQKMNDIFKSFGLTVEFNLKNKKITYSRENYINDISKKVSTGQSDLLALILDLLHNDNLMDPISNNGIGVALHLKELSQNNNYPTPDSQDELNINSIREKIENVVANNEALTESDITNLFGFYTRGNFNKAEDPAPQFNNLLEKINNWTDSGFNSVDEAKLFKGDSFVSESRNRESKLESSLRGRLSANVKDMVDSKFNDWVLEILDEEYNDKEYQNVPLEIAKISCDQLIDFAKAQDIIGFTKPIIKKIDNKYNICYITLTDVDFSFDQSKNFINIFVSVSINGYKIRIILPCSLSTTFTENNTKVSLTSEDVFIGNQHIRKETQNKIFNIIGDINTGEDKVFNITKEGEMYFAFNDILNDATIIDDSSYASYVLKMLSPEGCIINIPQLSINKTFYCCSHLKVTNENELTLYANVTKIEDNIEE